ncbi:MAG: hypothetical protein Q4D88_06065 [Anaerococcus sp.]|nr:hypothetical protein [Anaerococcus sp.]
MRKYEDFKRDLSRRLFYMAFMVFAMVAVLILASFVFDVSVVDGPIPFDYIFGFFVGIILGLLFLGVLTYRKAFSDRGLRELYISAKDERNVYIKMKSGLNVIPFLSVGLLFLSLIFVFINFWVFLTLALVGLGQVLVALVLFWYWSRRV